VCLNINFVLVKTHHIYFFYNMQNSISEKNKTTLLVEIIEYIPDGESIRTIIKKQTGTVKTKPVVPKNDFSETICPHDSYAQIVEGNAQINFEGKSQVLEPGNGIMIPANTAYSIASAERFKMILTIVKNNDN
jgi:mannose-6-phosphate isomerase-like protein (cupin superfamily)